MRVEGLELARVAQVVSVGAELAQAYKYTATGQHLAADTRVMLRVASHFTAADYLQVDASTLDCGCDTA